MPSGCKARPLRCVSQSSSSEVTLVRVRRDDAPPFQPQRRKAEAAQSEYAVQRASEADSKTAALTVHDGSAAAAHS